MSLKSLVAALEVGGTNPHGRFACSNAKHRNAAAHVMLGALRQEALDLAGLLKSDPLKPALLLTLTFKDKTWRGAVLDPQTAIDLGESIAAIGRELLSERKDE